jgi:hypothetical protein
MKCKEHMSGPHFGARRFARLMRAAVVEAVSLDCLILKGILAIGRRLPRRPSLELARHGAGWIAIGQGCEELWWLGSDWAVRL